MFVQLINNFEEFMSKIYIFQKIHKKKIILVLWGKKKSIFQIFYK
jgi:hypothetical protein